jgi:hypothetical protein
MEASNEKRARLRHELQQAYDAWWLTSETGAGAIAHRARVDISGSADVAKVKWFEYLAAKQRLVQAYADRPLAA